jgi:hypothetical protein
MASENKTIPCCVMCKFNKLGSELYAPEISLSESRQLEEQGIHGSHCMRFPPVVWISRIGNPMPDRPQVYMDDWCGEYQERLDESD